MNAHDTVIRYAARWGVTVLSGREAQKAVRQTVRRAPEFSAGNGAWGLVNWSTKPVIVRAGGDRTKSSLRWPWLLHELAHAVAPVDPDECDELQETLGFEVLSVRYLKLPQKEWSVWQDDYDLYEEIYGLYRRAWSDAPPAWRRNAIKRACVLARKLGLFVGSRPSFKVNRLAKGRSHGS